MTRPWVDLRRVAVRCVASGCAGLLLVAAAPPQWGRIGNVIDGDTVRLTSGERIRIARIDAPETQLRQAKCAREIVLGKAATLRARTLLAGRSVSIVRVGRSYGRTLARVTLDGRDLAGQLVEAGAAAWWPPFKPKPDWCGAR